LTRLAGIVSNAHSKPSVLRAVQRLGADGFVAKAAIGSELLDAVEVVLAGRHYPPEIGSPEP